jgi:hypothetical protein
MIDSLDLKSFMVNSNHPNQPRMEIKMRFKLLFLVMAALSIIVCSKKNATNPEVVSVEDLMVKNNEISGWNRVGEGWVASSESDLFNHIDGGAPLYTRHGFVEAADQDYSGKVLQDTVTVDLMAFDQGTSTNAQELFNEVSVSLLTPEIWQSVNYKEAKIERSPLSIRIIGWKSKYYASLTITSNLNESLEVLKTFADNVGSKIK